MFNRIHELAATKGSLEKIKALLMEDAYLLERPHSSYKTTPVYFAAQKGDLETLLFFIEMGADLNAKNAEDYNLLFFAMQNNAEIREYVANPKNKLIEQFNDDTTYFHALVVMGNHDEVNRLLDQNAHDSYLLTH